MNYAIKFITLMLFFLVLPLAASEQPEPKKTTLEIKGETLLRLCRRSYYDSTTIPEAKQLLLDKEFDYNKYVREYCSDKDSPLNSAITSRNKEIIALLIMYADKDTLNVRGLFGCTPLEEAVVIANIDEDQDMVKMLLDAKADVHLRGLHNSSPLLSAVAGNNKATISLLIEHGANGGDIDFMRFTHFYVGGGLHRGTIVFLQECLNKKERPVLAEGGYNVIKGLFYDEK